MTPDLSPEGINRTHGKPVWVCWGCKKETGLHWHNGWSVAMCRDPNCAKKYNELLQEQQAAEDSYQAYCKEYWGE